MAVAKVIHWIQISLKLFISNRDSLPMNALILTRIHFSMRRENILRWWFSRIPHSSESNSHSPPRPLFTFSKAPSVLFQGAQHKYKLGFRRTATLNTLRMHTSLRKRHVLRWKSNIMQFRCKSPGPGFGEFSIWLHSRFGESAAAIEWLFGMIQDWGLHHPREEAVWFHEKKVRTLSCWFSAIGNYVK